jgi:hypothetical protein
LKYLTVPLGIIGLIPVSFCGAAAKFIKIVLFRKIKDPAHIPHCYKNIRLDATGFAFLRAKGT